MPIELKMPTLSPTMEEGTLAKWLVKIGDIVKPGDLIAEIETDKATMEFEAIDEGRVSEIFVLEGAEGVAVGTVIAKLESSDTGEPPVAEVVQPVPVRAEIEKQTAPVAVPMLAPLPVPVQAAEHAKLKISPLALRIAKIENIDLAGVKGSGSAGRITKKDLVPSLPVPAAPAMTHASVVSPSPSPAVYAVADIPHDLQKLSSMRKTIARRLTESKQQVPHIYLSVDVRLDALMALRADLNLACSARGTKLSVNDMVIKALALALIEVPTCNVQFAGDHIAQFKRADVSVAVSIPGGLVTPIIAAAETKSLSAIATEMRELADRARAGKLQPHEYQGGTASLSNLGMFGISQFNAIINPPQAMIMAIGAGERRAVIQDELVTTATVMTVTGSFDHRIIDGADAAAFMQAFQRLLQNPLMLV
jgi:pyruvate dehydrogenase E2 component (dihydrolipoamide acetyltransferase)